MIHYWYIYLILAYGVTFIPVIGKYFSVLNTLFHEFGHALMSLLTNGKVYSISLFYSVEGVAATGSKNWFGRVLTSIAGYPFASITAFLCFYFIHKGMANYLLYGFIAVAALCLLLWVRNFYGIIWCATFIALSVFLLKAATPALQLPVTYFLSFIILTQSISTAIIILVLSVKKSKEAGDATNLARATFIPASFWGFVFCAQSFYFAYLIGKDFIFNVH